MDIEWIKEQVKKGNYQLKLHAVERASTRGIDPLEVKEALLNWEIIEDYPKNKRGHSCLVYGKTQIGRDIHVLCGVAYDILWIITVYEPDLAEWVNPKTRRELKWSALSVEARSLRQSVLLEWRKKMVP
jgi:hypothetical protein